MALRKPLVLLASGLIGEVAAGDALPAGDVEGGAMGLVAWSDPAAIITATFRPASGAVTFGFAVAAADRLAGSAVTVRLEVATAGATLTADRSFAGLYRSDGATLTRVAMSADQSGAWVSTGVKAAAMTLSANIEAGDRLYLALISAGTTIPTFRAGAAANLINVGAVRRRGVMTGQTTLPASVPLASVAAAVQAPGILVS